MYLYGFRDYSDNLPVFLINLIVDKRINLLSVWALLNGDHINII